MATGDTDVFSSEWSGQHKAIGASAEPTAPKAFVIPEGMEIDYDATSEVLCMKGLAKEGLDALIKANPNCVKFKPKTMGGVAISIPGRGVSTVASERQAPEFKTGEQTGARKAVMEKARVEIDARPVEIRTPGKGQLGVDPENPIVPFSGGSSRLEIVPVPTGLPSTKPHHNHILKEGSLSSSGSHPIVQKSAAPTQHEEIQVLPLLSQETPVPREPVTGAPIDEQVRALPILPTLTSEVLTEPVVPEHVEPASTGLVAPQDASQSEQSESVMSANDNAQVFDAEGKLIATIKHPLFNEFPVVMSQLYDLVSNVKEKAEENAMSLGSVYKSQEQVKDTIKLMSDYLRKFVEVVKVVGENSNTNTSSLKGIEGLISNLEKITSTNVGREQELVSYIVSIDSTLTSLRKYLDSIEAKPVSITLDDAQMQILVSGLRSELYQGLETLIQEKTKPVEKANSLFTT